MVHIQLALDQGSMAGSGCICNSLQVKSVNMFNDYRTSAGYTLSVQFMLTEKNNAQICMSE